MSDHHLWKKIAGIAAVAVCIAIVASAAVVQLPGKAKVKHSTSYAASGRSAVIGEVQLPGGTIDVNTDDIDELCELPGIGETLASAIITEREKNGDFYYPEDLRTVKGIGQAKIASIRDYLDLSVAEDDDDDYLTNSD